jgi:hypothetical protein
VRHAFVRLDGTSVTLRRHLEPRPLLAPPKQTASAPERLRVYVDSPALLDDLCDYLAADGCLAQPLTHREAAIAVPGAANEWEASETVKMEIRSWQAQHTHANVHLIA